MRRRGPDVLDILVHDVILARLVIGLGECGFPLIGRPGVYRRFVRSAAAAPAPAFALAFVLIATGR